MPVDLVTYEKYQELPPSPLRALMDEAVERKPQGAAMAAGAEPAHAGEFAQIRMDGQNQCPLLTSDRLCRIHAELGEGLLSDACSTYPRITHSSSGLKETALALSCPEAARLVLLTPDLLGSKLVGTRGSAMKNKAGETVSRDSADKRESPLPPDFWQIRAVVGSLVLNRLCPVWQRLFLLDILCRRLDSIARGELKRSTAEFLVDFEATVASGALRAAMDTLPLDREAQLDVVLRLAGLLLHRSNVRPRFAECIQAFTAGIGNGPGATIESLTAQYTVAHDSSYEPFFRRHPHIVENYLINTMVRCRFPFGRDGMKAGAQPQMARESALLTAQFALVKGLLIGVAGFHGPAFSAAHVVHTVQSAAKHFEHHPEFLNMAHGLLVESQMNGARGLAILLRNARPGSPAAIPPAINVPRPSLSTPPA